MIRTIAAVVVLLFAAAVGTHAQEPKARVFSKAAIEKAVAVNAKTTVAHAPAPAPAPRVPRSFKSFFHTPWPYIIGGAVAVGIIIAVNSGNNNGTGSGIY